MAQCQIYRFISFLKCTVSKNSQDFFKFLSRSRFFYLCQGAGFFIFMHSVKEQFFLRSSFDNTVSRSRFYDAQCQGADFIRHSVKELMQASPTEFKDLIGKETELKTMQFAGELDKEVIENIEEAKNYLDDKWYQKMQEIIEKTKVKRLIIPYPKELRRVS